MSTYSQNLKNLKNKKEVKTTKVFNLDTNEILEIKNENVFPLIRFNKNLEIYDELKHKNLLEEVKVIIEEIKEKNEITEEVKEILEQKSEEKLEQIVEEVEEIIVSKKNKKSKVNK